MARYLDKVLPDGWAGDGSVASLVIGGRIGPTKSFTPFQVIWLWELVCSIAGPAVVTLTGVRHDGVTTQTVATYNLAAGQTVRDVNDRTDYIRFTWASTGSGKVTARII